MKKFLMTLAAVLCCALTTTVFTSCSEEGDSLSNYATYAVNPKGEFANTNCMTICEKMREALKTGMEYSNGLCKRDDARAIRVCDDIYNKMTGSGHFKITLEVAPFGEGLESKSFIIKTYEY